MTARSCGATLHRRGGGGGQYQVSGSCFMVDGCDLCDVWSTFCSSPHICERSLRFSGRRILRQRGHRGEEAASGWRVKSLRPCTAFRICRKHRPSLRKEGGPHLTHFRARIYRGLAGAASAGAIQIRTLRLTGEDAPQGGEHGHAL